MTNNLNPLSPEEEKDLVERAKKSREAFGELYEVYFQKIYDYFLHRTANVDLTEDLVSQLFMKVMDNIEKYEWRGIPFSAWLYRIASNVLMTHYRRNKKISDVNLDDIEFMITDDEMTPLEQVKYNEEQRELKEKYQEVRLALKNLKPKYAEIIQYKFFEKMDNPEIANILNISEGNLRIRLHRALNQLKDLL